MSIWAIGDLQGCYDVTCRLLEKIKFDPAADKLWFCGDLVNRGGQSLETLRLVHSLREHSVVVLGNHDLSLLAVGARSEEEQRKVNPDLQRVVLAEDRDVLLDWLRMQRLIHVDRELGWMMFHAGLAPKWTVAMAEKHAREVENQLHGNGYRKLFRNMYGDQPSWAPSLTGYERSRAIINIFTRMRYCNPRGRIAMEDKGTPGTQGQGLYPWFEVPGRVERELKMVCGHWSALGLTITQGVHAIDTGAVWGGKLTALQLDSEDLRVVQVPGRDVPKPESAAAVRPPRRPRGEGRPAGNAPASQPADKSSSNAEGNNAPAANAPPGGNNNGQRQRNNRNRRSRHGRGGGGDGNKPQGGNNGGNAGNNGNLPPATPNS